jgi:phage host-nuclease inhibitor protein Gam
VYTIEADYYQTAIDNLRNEAKRLEEQVHALCDGIEDLQTEAGKVLCCYELHFIDLLIPPSHLLLLDSLI